MHCPRGVVDPWHVRTLHVREPGDLGGTRRYVTGRSGKACGHNPGEHAPEESDIGIVPKKKPNKIGRTNGGGVGGKAGDQGESWKNDCELYAGTGGSIERIGQDT